MAYNVEQIRQQFPALSLTDNEQPRIYLDNPAGTQVPAAVIESMQHCLVHANANLGGYFASSKLADAIYHDAHQAMADLLNARSADEIIFAQNMTTITLALSRSLAHLFKKGDEILLSRMDHDANVQPWVMMAKDAGLTVRWLPFNPDTFEFDLHVAQELINEKTRLLCVGGASNLLGTLNDVKSLCAMAKQVGALTYIDAVQSVPHVSTDVQALDCDFLVCSAYKFFGPHQGVLYARQSVINSLHAYKVRPASNQAPGSFETGTQSHEGMAGTAAAVNYFAWVGEQFAQSHVAKYPQFKGRRLHAHTGMDALCDYEATLSQFLIEGLSAINGIKIQGISERSALARRVPTVSFTSDKSSPGSIAQQLAKQNIFVWSGHNYAIEVVQALDLHESGGVVRVGPVHYNTRAEIDVLLNAIDTMH